MEGEIVKLSSSACPFRFFCFRLRYAVGSRCADSYMVTCGQRQSESFADINSPVHLWTGLLSFCESVSSSSPGRPSPADRPSGTDPSGADPSRADPSGTDSTRAVLTQAVPTIDGVGRPGWFRSSEVEWASGIGGSNSGCSSLDAHRSTPHRETPSNGLESIKLNATVRPCDRETARP